MATAVELTPITAWSVREVGPIGERSQERDRIPVASRLAETGLSLIQTLLDGEDIVAMRGDWTLPSAEISRYLEAFGRYGIPFNAVYGPALPDGLALPELLTGGAVVEALARAAGG